MWKRDRTPVASTMATTPTKLFDDVTTAPMEILSAEVARSLSIPARDAEDLLTLACTILQERPSRVAVLEDGRLSEGSACFLACAAAELQA
ncbi:hypothetical protein ACFFGH_26160 [Lysobacter korlensis]|uniref:Uncharacterized protein n=1 Tax=Lysobacter korlensis TaxID=553636 RepID=A0ABV6RWH0_9GAMM